jgi:transmembrane sensor
MTDDGNTQGVPDMAAIETEAAAWVARFDAGNISALEWLAFQAWLNRNVMHREVMAELGALWSALNQLKHAVEPTEG